MRSTPSLWRTGLSSASKLLEALGICTLCTMVGTGCQEYDPPPRVSLVLPVGGAWQEGEVVELMFSEPINVGTLKMKLWADVRDIEGQLPQGATPLVADCRVGSCADATVSLSEDKQRLMLMLPKETLGKAGPPVLLQIMEGLEDEKGNATGSSPLFTLQFRSALDCTNTEPVPFDSGTYILGGSVTKPVPAILTLISDVKVSEDGTFALAGAEGDEKPGFAKNTTNPDELFVDNTELGWTLFVKGKVCLRDGQRLLQTEVFDVRIPIGSLTVTLRQVRLVAEIKKDATGKDTIDGTLSFEGVELDNGRKVSKFEGGNTPLFGAFVPPEKRPAGTPELCGNPCGVVIGLCEPPDGFPGDVICPPAP